MIDKEKQRVIVRKSVNRLRSERRTYALSFLGGCCVDCGKTENLDFDHEDRQTKVASIGKLWTAAWPKFIAEVTKCKLRCKACHKSKGLRCGDIVEGKHGERVTAEVVGVTYAAKVTD